MQKIVPCLWFDNKAKEAVDFYTSVFGDVKVVHTARYDAESAKVSGMPEGSLLTIEFDLEGQRFIALNGGPIFTFSPAISFVVNCEEQDEVDRIWEKLSADPASEQCGWLKDKYGVSWQIVPRILDELLRDPDQIKAQRVMKAMLEMKKIDIQKLQEAYVGE